eukprot:358669-Chlamydomonas_euryale.AAC.2
MAAWRRPHGCSGASWLRGAWLIASSCAKPAHGGMAPSQWLHCPNDPHGAMAPSKQSHGASHMAPSKQLHGALHTVTWRLPHGAVARRTRSLPQPKGGVCILCILTG